MQKRLPQLNQTVAPDVIPYSGKLTAQTGAVATAQLPRLVEDWLADCQIRQHSPRTIEHRRMLAERLSWFLNERGATQCGRVEIRQFFAYLSNGHNDTGGRWGKSEKRYAKPLRPETVSTYFHHLRTFFNWLVSEEYLQVSPMDKIAPPVSRPYQVKPFSVMGVVAGCDEASVSGVSIRLRMIVSKSRLFTA